MPESAFYDAFVAAVAGDADALRRGWTADAGPRLAAGLSVYRNTIAKGCADALVAQFPSLLKLTGEPWLGAAAVAHAREAPPTQASLLTYGQAFPGWLAGAAADAPHLADIARLDMLWTEAHLAADAEPLDPAEVAALSVEDYARLSLALHPATRFALFDTTAPSLWLALQAQEAPEAFELEARPEGMVFTRPALEIAARRVGPGEIALLDGCRAGETLAAAAAMALEAEPDLALDRCFSTLIELGAFAALAPLETP